MEINPTQSISLVTGLDMWTSSVANTKSSASLPTSVKLHPGFLGCLGCDQELGKNGGPSRKRIGTEIGRLGRNIRQKLMCGFFPKEGNIHPHFIN